VNRCLEVMGKRSYWIASESRQFVASGLDFGAIIAGCGCMLETMRMRGSVQTDAAALAMIQ
jgi:hypothetical protein